MNLYIGRVVAALLSALAVAGGAWWLHQGRAAEPPVDGRLAGIKSGLRDAQSARFRELSPPAPGGIVCGQVNAKNAHGAFVGFVRFLSTSDRYAIEHEPLTAWARKDAMGGADDSVAELTVRAGVLEEQVAQQKAGRSRLGDAQIEALISARLFEVHWRKSCGQGQGAA